MEPSASGGWGRPCWSFLHCVTLDPHATHEERAHQKQALQALRAILPCPKCRASFQDFCKCTLHRCDPSAVGDYVCQLHDKVNMKLEKPAMSKTWEYWKAERTAHFERTGWDCHDDYLYFLFVLAFNYPERFAQGSRLATKYKDFVENASNSFVHTRAGTCVAKYVRDHPLSDKVLAGRGPLVDWVYRMYTSCTSAPHMELAMVAQAMESLRKEDSSG